VAVNSNRMKEIFGVVTGVIKVTSTSHVSTQFQSELLGLGTNSEGAGGTFWHKLCDLIRAWLTQLCTFAKTHWIIYFCTVCKIYLKRIKKIW